MCFIYIYFHWISGNIIIVAKVTFKVITFIVDFSFRGLTKTSRDDDRTPSLGPVSHQVDRRDGLGAITMSDAGTP